MPDSTENATIDESTPNGLMSRSRPLIGRGDHAKLDTQDSGVPATNPLNGGLDQQSIVTQFAPVETAPLNADGSHTSIDTLKDAASASTPSELNGHRRRDTHYNRARELDLICDRLRELHRQRQELHRAEKSMTLRIKAKCRRLSAGDKKEAAKVYAAMFGKTEHALAASALVVSEPFIRARSVLEADRKTTESAMVAEAKNLPVAEWVESIHGFGMQSLANIIGESGNLSEYSTVSKLWKRLGLAVISGERQRRVAGAAAMEHGYSPSRRSVMWNVGQAIFKAQSQRVDKETGEVIREAGSYRLIYDARKAYELPRCEAMTDDMIRKSTTGKYSHKLHAHNRATRYMEKELIKHLWRAWQGHTRDDTHTRCALPRPQRAEAA